MKTRVFCKECFQALKDEGLKDEIAIDRAHFWHPITDESIQKGRCPEDHVNFVWFAAPFYDLLYSKAVFELARLDTRSSVLNFFSAWENFVSHTVTLLLQKADISETPSHLKLSERRLGMYVGLYAAKTQQLPSLPEEDTTRMIRNKIIHDYKIPKEEEVLRVAYDIRGCMMKAIEALHPMHQDYVNGPDVALRQQKAVEKAEITTNNIQFVFMRSQIEEDIKQTVLHIRDERRL